MDANAKLPPFDPDRDNESVYDDEIAPLMTKIIAVCKEHNIPIVASFQYQDDGFCTTSILPIGCSDSLVRASREVTRREPEVYAFTITSSKP